MLRAPCGRLERENVFAILIMQFDVRFIRELKGLLEPESQASVYLPKYF